MRGPTRWLASFLVSLMGLGSASCTAGEEAPRSADQVEGAPLPGVTVRRVWSGPRADARGHISADGRYFAYGHPSSNLTVRYVGRDEERLIANFEALSRWGQWTPQPVLSHSGLMAFLLGGQAFLRGPREDTARWLAWREEFNERRWGPDRQVWALDLDRWRSSSVFLNSEAEEVRLFGWARDERRILTALGSSSGSGRLSFLRYTPDDPYTWGGEEVVRGLEVIPDWAALSPDDAYIAYDGAPPGGGDGDIHLVTAGGDDHRLLVASPSQERLLGWSPEGILYETDASGRPCVRLLPMVGPEPAQSSRLVRCDLWGISPMRFTDDGAYWYGVRRGQREIFVADFDRGSGRLRSEPTRVSHQGAVEPSSVRWSPDGDFVAYLSWGRRDRGGLHDPALFVRTLATGEFRRFVPEAGAIDLASLRWSPRGGELLFTGVLWEDRPSGQAIYLLDLGSGEQRLIPGLDGWGGPPPGAAIWTWEGRGILAPFADQGGREPLPYSLTRLDLTGTAEERWHVGWQSFGPIALLSPSDVAHGVRSRSDRIFHTSLETGETRILWWMEDQYLVAMDRIPGTKALLVATRSVRDPAHRTTRFWRLPLDTREPEPLDLEIDGLQDFHLHPDGDRIVFTADRSVEEVWVMEGLPGGR